MPQQPRPKPHIMEINIMFKNVNLAKGKKENTVLNFKGESVEFMDTDGRRYFENSHTTEGFSERNTTEFWAGIGALLMTATGTPILLNGKYAGENAPRGTVRANEDLQTAIKAACTAAIIPFDYVTDLLKSAVAGLEGANTPPDYGQLRKDALAQYEESLKVLEEFKTHPAYNAMIQPTTELYKKALADIMARETKSNKLKAAIQTRKESEEVKKANKPEAAAIA